jgi:hypothetical protein
MNGNKYIKGIEADQNDQRINRIKMIKMIKMDKSGISKKTQNKTKQNKTKQNKKRGEKRNVESKATHITSVCGLASDAHAGRLSNLPAQSRDTRNARPLMFFVVTGMQGHIHVRNLFGNVHV